MLDGKHEFDYSSYHEDMEAALAEAENVLGQVFRRDSFSYLDVVAGASDRQSRLSVTHLTAELLNAICFHNGPCSCCLCRLETDDDIIGLRDAFGDNNSVLLTLFEQLHEELRNGKYL